MKQQRTRQARRSSQQDNLDKLTTNIQQKEHTNNTRTTKLNKPKMARRTMPHGTQQKHGKEMPHLALLLAIPFKNHYQLIVSFLKNTVPVCLLCYFISSCHILVAPQLLVSFELLSESLLAWPLQLADLVAVANDTACCVWQWWCNLPCSLLMLLQLPPVTCCLSFPMFCHLPAPCCYWHPHGQLINYL